MKTVLRAPRCTVIVEWFFFSLSRYSLYNLKDYVFYCTQKTIENASKAVCFPSALLFLHFPEEKKPKTTKFTTC